jgi:hypothetical protein
MRREPGTKCHRDFRSTQGPFQGPLKIAVAGKSQTAALGVAQPKALHGWRDIANRSLSGHLS